MPASMSAFSVKLDPIHTSLKKQLKNEETTKEESLTERLTAASKQLLLSDIEYEHAQEESYLLKENLKKKYSCITDGSCSETTQTVPRTSLKDGGDGEPLKSPQTVLFDRRDVRIGWQRKYPVGAGLHNVGNTCFLNSTLQTLIHCAPLVNWLLGSNNHVDRCRAEGFMSQCTLCAMKSVVLQAHNMSRNAFKPSQIISKLKLICKTMQLGRQEDAHEFLAHLLTSMAKSYLAVERALKQDQRSQETTPIHQIFGGYMRSQVKCLSCNFASNTYEHFQQILVDLPQGCSTLNACLHRYFRKETLDGVNSYVCPRCKKKVPATKRFSIERPPNVLTITLKRFMSFGGKNNRHIEYQETVDLTPFMKEASDCRIVYRLTGMILHLGSSQHSGHYTAISKAPNSQFFYFDDENVRCISPEQVLAKCPYIMFYEPKGSFMNSLQSSPKSCASTSYDRLENKEKNLSPHVHKPDSSASPQRSHINSNSFSKNSSPLYNRANSEMLAGDMKKKLNTYPSCTPKNSPRVIDEPSDGGLKKKVNSSSALSTEPQSTSSSLYSFKVPLTNKEKPPRSAEPIVVAPAPSSHESSHKSVSARCNGTPSNKPVKLVDYEDLENEGDSRTRDSTPDIQEARPDKAACTVKGWTVTSNGASSNEEEDRQSKRKEMASSSEDNSSTSSLKSQNSKKAKHKESSRDYSDERNSGSIFSKLCSDGGLSGYGNSVKSWSGDKNALDQNIARSREGHHSSEYDDEFDRGRTKKMKEKRWHKRNWRKYNPFQHVQNKYQWNRGQRPQGGRDNGGGVWGFRNNSRKYWPYNN